MADSSEKTVRERPSVFAYDDYRVFLRDFFLYQKESPAGFSFRRFSELAGFRAPNFLKLVIDGHRNMTVTSVRQTARAFGLNHDETLHLRNLVLMSQAKSSIERAKYAREICRSKTMRSLYPLKEAELRYFSRWYYIPIRELAALADFRDDESWISQAMRKKITPAQAREALDELEAIGALVRDGRGRLRPRQPQVTTGHEVRSAAVAEYHRQMLANAAAAIDEIARDQREISGSTLLLTASQFTRLKEMIQEFRRSLLAEEKLDEAGSRRVYQFGCQLFPLTEDCGTTRSQDGKSGRKK